MERMKVSGWRKVRIKEWLTLKTIHKDGSCPFRETPHPKSHCLFCKSWFPRVDINHTCPCGEYTINHIIRTAKIMLKSGVGNESQT